MRQMKTPKQRRRVKPHSVGPVVRRSRRSKHRMMRFKSGRLSGWNYRGYCVTEKCPSNAGVRWQMADENGEWGWFFRTLAEFRKTCDRWERQRAKEAAQEENSSNTQAQPPQVG